LAQHIPRSRWREILSLLLESHDLSLDFCFGFHIRDPVCSIVELAQVFAKQWQPATAGR
jgi:hypothetical protein